MLSQTIEIAQRKFEQHLVNGGNLGETNSVGFMFDRIGLISYPKDLGSSEAAFEAAV